MSECIDEGGRKGERGRASQPAIKYLYGSMRMAKRAFSVESFVLESSAYKNICD